MLGVVLYQQGGYAAAMQCFAKAIAIEPGIAAAHLHLGLPLQRLGRCEEALASYDRALLLQPDSFEALLNRGNALQDLGRYEEGLASYERALALRPAHAEALYNRGNALQSLRRYAAALASYDLALEARPDYPEAHVNRGITCEDLDRRDEALASYDRALALRPDYLRALENRGATLQSLNRWSEAAGSFGRVIARAPEHDYALGNLLSCRLHTCEWGDLAQLADRTEAAVVNGARAVSPFSFLAISGAPSAQLRCARTWVDDKYPRAHEWADGRRPGDRIRVAYLSADFRDHPVAFLLARLFEIHDRRRFEPIAVSFRRETGAAMERRVGAAFDVVVDASGMSDGEVAAKMRELKVDIAVDLMGFTTGSRPGILALRPAPIQVNYLGFPATMGARFIDYIIADEYVVPRGSEAHYAESVARLPDSFQANDDTRQAAERRPTRAQAGLPEAGFVFCSFNKPYKINPALFDVWMRLLRQVAGSVLWLYADHEVVRRNLRAEAEKRGVAHDRLVFASLLRYPDHLARLGLADLFLDTVPFNAGATCSDALHSGVPVLTCSGEAFASRMAGSLLSAAGLSTLITRDLAEYEARAFQLAYDRAMLGDIRDDWSRARASNPLFDSDRFRSHLEAAYLTMWERFQRGEPPATFSVAA